MSAFELLIVDPTFGVPTYPLPDRTDLQFSPVFSAVGAVSFKYPNSGVNAVRLRPSVAETDVEIAVMMDGVEIYDLRFIITAYSGDEADVAEEGFSWTYTGRTMMCLLERAVVYPPGFGTPDVEDTKKFTNGTAGEIMGTLITDAQSRGTINELIIGTFSQTHDSNGILWTKQITIEYRVGLQYSDVLLNLIDQGMVEAKVEQRELMLYNPGTLTEDRTLTNPPVIFQKGRDLSDAPRSVTKENIASVFLAGGSDGIYAESINATAEAVFGRIEAFDSQGGVSDPGTLASYADAQRDLRAQVTMEKSHGLVFGAGCPEPVTDFNLGDYVWSDTDGTLERLRVKQWAVSEDSSGNLSGVVVLGDLFSELQDDIVKRVKGILGGTTLTGESRATDTSGIIDTIPPVAPTGLAATTGVYMERYGATRAQVTLTWDPVVLNTDGSTVDDLDAYLVRFKLGFAAEWSSNSVWETGPCTAYFSNLEPGIHIYLEVAARDTSGNISAWSSTYDIILALDTTPPAKASDPVVTDNMSYIRVTWDGLTDSGAAWAGDMAGVEVHQSLSTGFTPSPSTYVGHLPLKGSLTVPSLSGPDIDNFFKLVSYDYSGNAGPASDQGVGQAHLVVATDLDGNIIDYSNVKFKDAGNLVADGSFELQETQDDYVALGSPRFSVIDDPTGTGPSKRVLKCLASGSPASTVWFNRYINANPDQKHCMIVSWRSHGLAVGDYVHVQITSHFPDGSADYNSWFFNITSASTADTWFLRQAVVAAVRPGADRVSIGVANGMTTSGAYVLLDQIEVRPVIPTILIDDAAITNAKIANLAVNNAKIADLQVGKLTSGTMVADVLLAGSIKTATSGQRVEILSSGLFGYDSVGTQIFYVTTTGLAGITGELAAVDTSTGNGCYVKPTANVYDPALPDLHNPGVVFGFSSSWYIYPGVWAKSDGTIGLSGYMNAIADPQGFLTLNKNLGQFIAAGGSSSLVVIQSGSNASGGAMGKLRFFGKLDEGPYGYASGMWTQKLTGLSFNRTTGFAYTFSVSHGFSLNSVPKQVCTFDNTGVNAVVAVSWNSITVSGYGGTVSNLWSVGSALVFTSGILYVWGWQSA